MDPQKSELVIKDSRVYHLGLAKEEFAPNVFIAGDPARAKRIADSFDLVFAEVSHREFVTYTGTYQGIPVSAIGTGIGTDNVEITLVELYALNEFDFETKKRVGGERMNILRLGTSGGVQEGIAPGSQAIARYSVGLDSTGVYYEVPCPDEIAAEIEEGVDRRLNSSIEPDSRFKNAIRSYSSKASEDFVKALESAASDREVQFQTGIAVSAPGFYGPSSRQIAGIQNVVPTIKQTLAEVEVGGMRILNMEMESSLLFHMCEMFGYRAGMICSVISGPSESDALIDYDKAIQNTIDVGLEAMVRVCGDD